MIIPLLLKHEMHMARPVTMPLQPLQQLPHRPVVRNWIWYRYNCLEPEVSILIAVHYCSLVRSLAAGVLDVVEAFAVRLPDVDLDVGNGFTVCVFECAHDQTWFAVGVMSDGRAVGLGFGFVGVEGAEDGAFGAVGWFGMVDAVDEKGEAEDIGEEDELLRLLSMLADLMDQIVVPV